MYSNALDDDSKIHLFGYTVHSHSKHAYGKRKWYKKRRAGLSFFMVIAFFAVFVLIILIEIFLIDGKSTAHGVSEAGSDLQYIGYNHIDDAMSEFDDVNDEYSIESAVFGRNRFREKHRAKDSDGLPRNFAWGSILPGEIERTLPAYGMAVKPMDGTWQIVNGTRFKFFVYSAFYDRRGGKLIRIIGATRTHRAENVWCRFVYNAGNSTARKYHTVSVMARVKAIRENWNLKYSACFVLCPVKTPNITVPYAVSVVSRLRSPPGNILLVRNTDDDADFIHTNQITNIPEKIGICVKPFHFDYNSALNLLEFLELNTILGASHFTFYNHTLGRRANCVLKHYMNGDFATIDSPERDEYRRATVNVLPWDLRMHSQKEIRTEGLFAALNDCIYRNMYRYQYVALIDLDEFIIPRNNNSLSELLKQMTHRKNGRNAGAFLFQNSFFYLQFPDDSIVYSHNNSVNAALRATLITQRKTRRRAKLNPQRQRSKYIAKPDAVVEAGNHFVWEFVPGKGALNVPADAGILHHYRVCEFGGNGCIRAPSVQDQTAHTYSDRLVRRVNEIYNQLKEPCNLAALRTIPRFKTTEPTEAATPPPRHKGPLIGEIKSIFTNSVHEETIPDR